MKFRKLPVIIEADQYHEFSLGNIPGVCCCDATTFGVHLHTIHQGQIVELQDGDWVVAESDGKHFYPVKDEVFRKTYEPV